MLTSLVLHHWGKGLLTHCAVFCGYEATKTFLGMFRKCGVFTLFKIKRKQKSLQRHRTLSISGQKNHIYSPISYNAPGWSDLSTGRDTSFKSWFFLSNLFWKKCGQQAFCSFLHSYLTSFLSFLYFWLAYEKQGFRGIAKILFVHWFSNKNLIWS